MMKVKYSSIHPGFMPAPGGVKPAAWPQSISGRARGWAEEGSRSAGESGGKGLSKRFVGCGEQGLNS